jgi:hypothetical protein
LDPELYNENVKEYAAQLDELILNDPYLRECAISDIKNQLTYKYKNTPKIDEVEIFTLIIKDDAQFSLD